MTDLATPSTVHYPPSPTDQHQTQYQAMVLTTSHQGSTTATRPAIRDRSLGATFVIVQEAVTGFPVFAFLSSALYHGNGGAVAAFCASGGRGESGDVGAASSVVVQPEKVRTSQTRLLPGIVIGLALFAGYAFQTFGLHGTTPAKAGFVDRDCRWYWFLWARPCSAPATGSQRHRRGRACGGSGWRCSACKATCR